MKNNLSISISDMKYAISSWESVRNTSAGYYYLTSGTRFEFSRQNYIKWLDLKAKGAKIDKIYCHLGVWENELIFILSVASNPKELKEDDTFAILFYTDLNGQEEENTITEPKNTSVGNTSNIITENQAMTRLMSWMLYSQEWFQAQKADKKEIMKYVEIDFTDFSNIFDAGVESLISFFAIRNTVEHGDIAELILASKPTLSSNNIKSNPENIVYMDVTLPVPPFKP